MAGGASGLMKRFMKGDSKVTVDAREYTHPRARLQLPAVARATPAGVMAGVRGGDGEGGHSRASPMPNAARRNAAPAGVSANRRSPAPARH